MQLLGSSLDRSASSIIKQSLEGFLDGIGDSDGCEELLNDLGATLRQAGRLRLMRQRAAWNDD